MTSSTNTIQEFSSPLPEGESPASLELSSSPALTTAADTLGTVKAAVMHDIGVSSEQIEQLSHSLGQIMVDVGGVQIPLFHLNNSTEFKWNREIWNQIRAGDFGNHTDLTILPDEIAAYFTNMNNNSETAIFLGKVRNLSDKAIEILVKNKVKRPRTQNNKTPVMLDLGGLENLSEKAAKLISNYGGKVWLNGLTTLSNTAVQHLSKHKGSFLCLSGLTALSDTSAMHLSQYKGSLNLESLQTLSDTAIEHLSLRNRTDLISSEIQTRIDAHRKMNPIKSGIAQVSNWVKPLLS